MNLRSIRLRLPLTYAGIALLAALALGAVLLSTLRGYYAGLERRHLQANADEIASTMAQLLAAHVPDFAINDQVKSWSFFLEARLQLKDSSGRLLADSGLPDARRLLTVSNPPGADVLYKSAPASLGLVASGGLTETVGLPPWQMYILPPGGPVSGTVVISAQKCTRPSGAGSPECKTLIMQIPGRSASLAPDFTLPLTDTVTSTLAISSEVGKFDQAVGVAMPLTRSLYGFSLATAASDPLARSDQIVEQQVLDAAGRPLGTILLSSGPAYGSEILGGVARGWLVSSLVAVLLAGLVGWWVSRNLTAPLLALAAVTGRMAAGDLSARAAFQSRDEIGDLGRSFNDMAGRVEATVHTLRNFVGDAAHQLHTPLTALNTYLELARDEPGAGQKTAYLVAAGDQVDRLKTVIDGLLELSRLEDSPVEHTTFDLKGIAGELAEIFASRAEQAGLQFSYEAPDEPLLINGAAPQLREALADLLDNAFKFTPSGGAVSLRLSVEESQAVVSVTDTGIGLTSEDLPRLFARFYRGRNAAAYPGSGLGLAIVHSILAAHGGSISAEPLEPGARFLLRLPLMQS